VPDEAVDPLSSRLTNEVSYVLTQVHNAFSVNQSVTSMPSAAPPSLICAVALLSQLVVSLPVSAGQYEALCGGVKCTITVSASGISSPFGTIPPKRVTYWGNSGESKTSVETGVATTVLFGGIGLLGFLAKNHQYSFTVNGFDASGRNVSMQFNSRTISP
jgi:hypothetical protein